MEILFPVFKYVNCLNFEMSMVMLGLHMNEIFNWNDRIECIHKNNINVSIS